MVGEANEGTRRYPRLAITEQVTADVTATQSVRLLDIGLGGVRIAHTGAVHPGASCQLRLPVRGLEFPLPCRVIWTHLMASDEAEGSMGPFQSGLEFLGLSPTARALLEAFIRSRKGLEVRAP